MCEECGSIAAAVSLGHAVEFPMIIGGAPRDRIVVVPLDDDEG